jgi:hypothetical protein
MKIEWQAEDIVPGRVVGHPDRIERWMVGYRVTPSGNEYALVSLSDGMIRPFTGTQDIAGSLNKSGEMPVEFFSDPSHVKRGQKGAPARAAALTPERRSEIAAKAANTRWNGQ